MLVPTKKTPRLTRFENALSDSLPGDIDKELAERGGVFIEGLPIEKYFEFRNFVSAHGLMDLGRSPAHFQSKSIEPVEPSAAYLFGTLAHTAVLEPHRYLAHFKISPDFGDMRSSKNREAKAAYLADSGPETIHVDEKDHDKVRRMIDAIQGHADVSKLLSRGTPELSGFFLDPNGTPTKFRPDYLRNDLTIVDYKTIEDARYNSFERQFGDYEYYFQAGFYLRAISILSRRVCNDFWFVTQEKKPPFGVMLYEPDPEDLELAKQKIDATLALYEKCKKTGTWPGYRQDAIRASISPWKRRQILSEIETIKNMLEDNSWAMTS